MKQLKTRLVFISLFAVIFFVRWTLQTNPLPSTWTQDSVVKFTAPILEEPRHTESYTIIETGIWQIKIKGYQKLDTGKYYLFTGTVVPTVLLGKVSKIEMVDPTFDELVEKDIGGWGRVVVAVGRVRERVVEKYQKSLPEPHAALSAGILLGVKQNMPYDFYQALLNTGTVHIIAASGYNVTMVARVVLVPLMQLVARPWAIAFSLAAILLYVILAGGSAAVVRAGIMGSLTLMAFYFGRQAEAKRLLWVTAAIMLFIQPLMLVDVGFQLSLAATAGLLYFEPKIRDRFKIYESRFKGISGFLDEYLWPTLAASIATAPIIMITFGRLSLISPIVNMLVLPLTPLIMFLSAVSVGLSWIPILDKFSMWLLYVPLEMFIGIIELFG